MLRERRSLKVLELRAEKTEDGKQYLGGYAANYNILSEDLGWGMRERIMPGAFARAVKEGQDVRHLINHDPNLVLGRTKAGTTELSEDAKGLKFRTLMPDTSYARDVFESVTRGDIDECSFGFMAVRTAWIEEPDPDDDKRIRCIRELHDVDLFDISTVTYPAYPGTNTDAERALKADGAGVPIEIRSRLTTRDMDDEAAELDVDCVCQCPECLDGDCVDCSDSACQDANCRCMDARAARNKPEKTKRVHGENLTAECFLIAGEDPEKTEGRKLPWKFSTEEKTTQHLYNCLARFNEISATEEEKSSAWKKLVEICKERSLNLSEDQKRSVRDRLTPEQLYDFDKDSILIVAQAKVRAIQASL